MEDILLLYIPSTKVRSQFCSSPPPSSSRHKLTHPLWLFGQPFNWQLLMGPQLCSYYPKHSPIPFDDQPEITSSATAVRTIVHVVAGWVRDFVKFASMKTRNNKLRWDVGCGGCVIYCFVFFAFCGHGQDKLTPRSSPRLFFFAAYHHANQQRLSNAAC